MESIPHALVTVDTIPPDRVPVLIPQDNSSRYREMNLRNRKGDSSKNGVARKVGSEEVFYFIIFFIFFCEMGVNSKENQIISLYATRI